VLKAHIECGILTEYSTHECLATRALVDVLQWAHARISLLPHKAKHFLSWHVAPHT